MTYDRSISLWLLPLLTVFLACRDPTAPKANEALTVELLPGTSPEGVRFESAVDAVIVDVTLVVICPPRVEAHLARRPETLSVVVRVTGSPSGICTVPKAVLRYRIRVPAQTGRWTVRLFSADLFEAPRFVIE